jgi:hypothetical protein
VSLPITLMSDMFDCVTLNVCEELFHIVEKHVATWTSVSTSCGSYSIVYVICISSFSCINHLEYRSSFCFLIELSLIANIGPVLYSRKKSTSSHV